MKRNLKKIINRSKKDPIINIAQLIVYIFYFNIITTFWGCAKNITTPLIFKKNVPKLSKNLYKHVDFLSNSIGERHILTPKKLKNTAQYISRTWKNQGYKVNTQTINITNQSFFLNLWIEIIGKETPDEIIVVGSHYDTAIGSPGADDNSSGIAALLEISKLFRKLNCKKTIRFIAFTNEEYPFFKTNIMGSHFYAKKAKANKDNIIGMVSIESIGYYSSEPNSQKYPFPIGLFYPNKGNFIAIVSNLSSRPFNKKFVNTFKTISNFPLESLSTFSFIPGIDRSDHRSFWEYGYQGIMITDTVPFRNPYYHTKEDTIDKLNFNSFSKVTYSIYLSLTQIVGIYNPS